MQIKNNQMTLPRLLRHMSLLAASLCALSLHAEERLTVAYPGPHNIPFLPIDVAQKIGADKAEGIRIVPHHTGSGIAALQQLQKRNVDFTVAGAPAAMSARANGNDIVTLAAVDDLPLCVLTVRADLKDRIKRPRDLAGRVVGVPSSSLSVKTIPHLLAELILKTDGLPSSQVRIVTTGQSWEEQSALVRSKSVDALLGIEPFASRLRDDGLVFFLFNLRDPGDAARIPGAGFLQASLQTRSDVLHNSPQKAEKMVATIRRTLEWMASHTPEQIIDALQIPDARVRTSLLNLLRQHPRLYSRDGKFSDRQVAETNRFYTAANDSRKPIDFESMIDARWAGNKP